MTDILESGATSEFETKKRTELRRMRDEINEYLSDKYNYMVPEDPVVLGNYVNDKFAMCRTVNVVEVLQKIEYLIHPKVKLVSDEVKKYLYERAVVIRTIITPQWATNENLKAGLLINAEQISQGAREELEKAIPRERLDREYRTQSEVDLIRSSIEGVVRVLDQELSR